MNKIKYLSMLLVAFFVFSAIVSAQTEQVVIYNDYNFQGANTALTQSWNGGGGFDRNIRSIRVPQGFRVTIYEKKNYKGAESRLTEDWNPGAGAHWITRIRSIRIDRAQILPPVRPLPPTPPSFPVIYAGTNFDGTAEAVERDKADLNDWDGSPHTIRSIRVPEGWYFVLYTKRNFRGKSYNVNSNITFAPGDEWYNRIRSIKVYKGNPPIQPR
jgi:Peptidase inhibitor family I36/Beta/Gamma crystallin